MPNPSSQSSKSSLGCLGYLGNLLVIIFVGCLIFGYSGVSIRLGSYFFAFGTGMPSKTNDVDSDNPSVNLGNLGKTISAAANQFHEQLSFGNFK